MFRYPMWISFRTSRHREFQKKEEHAQSADDFVAVMPPKKPSWSKRKHEPRKSLIQAPYGWKSKTVKIEVEATLDVSAPAHDTSERLPVAVQVKDLITQEVPFLTLCVFCILIAEHDKLERTRHRWLSIWGVIFETASAFGTCGLTLSTSATCTASFLSNFGKCVVMVVMLCGRHRNLPYAMDPKVDIPKEVRLNRAQKQWSKAAKRVSNIAAFRPRKTNPEMGGQGSSVSDSVVSGGQAFAPPAHHSAVGEKSDNGSTITFPQHKIPQRQVTSSVRSDELSNESFRSDDKRSDLQTAVIISADSMSGKTRKPLGDDENYAVAETGVTAVVTADV